MPKPSARNTASASSVKPPQACQVNITSEARNKYTDAELERVFDEVYPGILSDLSKPLKKDEPDPANIVIFVFDGFRRSAENATRKRDAASREAYQDTYMADFLIFRLRSTRPDLFESKKRSHIPRSKQKAR